MSWRRESAHWRRRSCAAAKPSPRESTQSPPQTHSSKSKGAYASQIIVKMCEAEHYPLPKKMCAFAGSCIICASLLGFGLVVSARIDRPGTNADDDGRDGKQHRERA